MARLLKHEEWSDIGDMMGTKIRRFHASNIQLNGGMLAAIFCSDGDHSEDKFQYLGRLSTRRHIFACNAGPLWLWPDFVHPNKKLYPPEDQSAQRRFWLAQFVEAKDIKNPVLNVVKGHYPCAVGSACQLTPEANLRAVVSGTLSLAQQFGRCRFVTSTETAVRLGDATWLLTLFHITNGTSKRSYLVDVRHASFDDIWRAHGMTRKSG